MRSAAMIDPDNAAVRETGELQRQMKRLSSAFAALVLAASVIIAAVPDVKATPNGGGGQIMAVVGGQTLTQSANLSEPKTSAQFQALYAWASGATMYAPLADAQTTDTVIISKADFRRTTGILYVAASSSLANVTMDVYATSSTLGTWWIGTLTPIGGGKFKGSFTPPVSPASYDGPRTITVQSSGGGSATRDIKIR